jgi:hypothetical protein
MPWPAQEYDLVGRQARALKTWTLQACVSLLLFNGPRCERMTHHSLLIRRPLSGLGVREL